MAVENIKAHCMSGKERRQHLVACLGNGGRHIAGLSTVSAFLQGEKSFKECRTGPDGNALPFRRIPQTVCRLLRGGTIDR